MTRLLAGMLLCLSLAGLSPAGAANRTGTDFGDMWWNPSESGWGVNIDHQGTTVFMTLYSYGADGKSKWFIASNMPSQGAFVFAGTLLEASGPVLANSFNPAAVTYRQVGNATLTFTSISTANLTVSIDGTSVTKAIQRYTFATNSMDGSYIGGIVAVQRSCGATSRSAATYTITQSGNTATIAMQTDAGLNCTMSGNYAQDGRMGTLIGSQTCTNGTTGQFQAFEIETGYQGLFARYSILYPNGCTESGRFGGLAQ